MQTIWEIIWSLISYSNPGILFEKSEEDMDENEIEDRRRKIKSFWKGIGVLIFIFVGGGLLGWFLFKYFG